MFAKKSIARLGSVSSVIVFMLALLPFQVAQAAGVRHAKPAASGTGNCLSWANACTLQTALTGAVSGDEIWVAAGTHKPATGTDRAATFQLKDGVALYGGFAGTESLRTQRNPVTHVTVLSGDIDNNDSQTPIITDLSAVTGNTTNSYQVVLGATGATLDGFTITAGYASGASTANYGGGMYDAASDPVLTDVTFSGNWAGYGGGMFNDFGSKPSLTGVTFNGNSAANQGGGLFSQGASIPTLVNVTFTGNSASQGGGMFNHNGSNASLTNVSFIGNSATNQGGGMLNQYSSNVTLTDVTFNGNSATNQGGGMYNAVSSNAAMANVTFSANAADKGGAIYNSGSSPTMNNVTFNDNSATDHGGGMYIADYSYPEFHNTIFWGNTAVGGIGAQIYNYSGNTTSSDSIVQGGCADTSWSCGTNIITADPKLGALGYYGGFTKTIPLTAGSSAIDATSSNCPATDQRGVPRGTTCDIGAYEYYADTTVPVVNTFTAPALTTSLAIPITAFTASDDIFVTDYMITETASAPAADAAGWTGTAPSTYAVSSIGTYILYPWARDEAGNVSAVFGSPASVRVVNAIQVYLPLIRR